MYLTLKKVESNPIRRDIIRYLSENYNGASSSRIANGTGHNLSIIQHHLHVLVKFKLVILVKHPTSGRIIYFPSVDILNGNADKIESCRNTREQVLHPVEKNWHVVPSRFTSNPHSLSPTQTYNLPIEVITGELVMSERPRVGSVDLIDWLKRHNGKKVKISISFYS